MKMVNRWGALPSNTAVSLLALFLALVVGLAAGRAFLGAWPQPAGPVQAPVENPASIAPTVQAPAVPTSSGGAAPFMQTGPAPQTTDSAPSSLRPAAPTVAPESSAPTVAPRASAPPGPATTAAPGKDIHTIAPEPGLPGPAQPGFPGDAPPPGSK